MAQVCNNPGSFVCFGFGSKRNRIDSLSAYGSHSPSRAQARSGGHSSDGIFSPFLAIPKVYKDSHSNFWSRLLTSAPGKFLPASCGCIHSYKRKIHSALALSSGSFMAANLFYSIVSTRSQYWSTASSNNYHQVPSSHLEAQCCCRPITSVQAVAGALYMS